MDEQNIFGELTELAEAAVALHEFFTSLVSAGFTEDQALRYMAYMNQRPESHE